jgi:hypothetical protein
VRAERFTVQEREEEERGVGEGDQASDLMIFRPDPSSSSSS